VDTPGSTPSATPPAPSPPGPAAPDAPPPDPKAEALVHFERGLSLFDTGAWDAALAEFLEARRLYPLRNATYNAVLCLANLHRYDEALVMLSGLLRDAGDGMPPEARDRALRKLSELSGRVGLLEIEGAEIGATLLVDGLSRGPYPLLAPLQVNAGSHLVRLTKPGFEPFEARVEVAGRQSVRVVAEMQPLLRSGRLRIVEPSGRALSVVIDGGEVGKTPWEGQLPVGEHVVLLRGEGLWGTPPVNVTVDQDRTTPLQLAAEPLTAELRVAPVPVNATVAIDAVTVGRGIWEGRLGAGVHRVEVTAPGFLPLVQEVSLGRGSARTLSLSLARDPSSPFVPGHAHFLVELSSAALFAPSFGDVSGQLGMGTALTGRFGYALPSGLVLGAALGGLRVLSPTAPRASTIAPVDLRQTPERQPAPVVFDGASALSGVVAGAFVGLSLGEAIRYDFRFGAGALLGEVGEARVGRAPPGGAGARLVGTTFEAHPVRALYLAPEARVGVALGHGVTLGVGLEVLAVLSPSPPRWDAARTHLVVLSGASSRPEYGTFSTERMLSPIQLVFAPSLAARYEF
jgi:hypothetical protein